MRKDSRIQPALEALEGKALLSTVSTSVGTEVPSFHPSHHRGTIHELAVAVGAGSVVGVASLDPGHLKLTSGHGKLNGPGSITMTADILSNQGGGSIVIAASKGRVYRLTVDNAQANSHVNKSLVLKTHVFNFAIDYHQATSTDPENSLPPGKLILTARFTQFLGSNTYHGTYTSRFFPGA